jgi:hypothetical protein
MRFTPILVAAAFVALSGCTGTLGSNAAMQNAIMQQMKSGACQVAGTAAIPGAVNLSFQCQGQFQKQVGTQPAMPPVTAARRAAIAPNPSPTTWPLPNPLPPLPPLGELQDIGAAELVAFNALAPTPTRPRATAAGMMREIASAAPAIHAIAAL